MPKATHVASTVLSIKEDWNFDPFLGIRQAQL